MGRYFVLTAAFGLLFNRKPCQVRFNSLQLQGSPWFHLFLADYPLDLFLVLLLLVLVFSCLFFLVLVSFSFGLLVVPFWVPLGFFLRFLVSFLFGVFVLGSFLGPLGFWFGCLLGSLFVLGCFFVGFLFPVFGFCFGFLFGPFFGFLFFLSCSLLLLLVSCEIIYQIMSRMLYDS